jgi:hypothetical protein
MKPIGHLIIVLITITGLYVRATGDIFDELAVFIKNGDTRQISRYFGSSVDLTILSVEDVFSKAQAEQVLKDFFSKNPAKSFTIIHKGLSKEGSKYAIGTYVTVQGISFRTYLFIKSTGKTEVIQEMRFEKE